MPTKTIPIKNVYDPLVKEIVYPVVERIFGEDIMDYISEEENGEKTIGFEIEAPKLVLNGPFDPSIELGAYMYDVINQEGRSESVRIFGAECSPGAGQFVIVKATTYSEPPDLFSVNSNSVTLYLAFYLANTPKEKNEIMLSLEKETARHLSEINLPTWTNKLSPLAKCEYLSVLLGKNGLGLDPPSKDKILKNVRNELKRMEEPDKGSDRLGR